MRGQWLRSVWIRLPESRKRVQCDMKSLWVCFLMNVALWAVALGDAPLVIMRHALAPGTGDPAGFRVEDCATQRNLSEQGKRQALRAGELLREQGLEEAEVLTSAWCRCRDTATRLKLGEVSVFPALNSFFQARENEAEQMKALREWIREWDGKTPVVMVTHQVVMTSLTGQFPASGEIWFLKRNEQGNVEIVRRLRVPLE